MSEKWNITLRGKMFFFTIWYRIVFGETDENIKTDFQ